MYINSPGGSVTAGMAIYDTMQFVGCDVATVCLGLAASMGQFLLTAGARQALHPAERPDHDAPAVAGLRGQASDIAIQAEQLRLHQAPHGDADLRHTGQPSTRSPPTPSRDRWFTAEQAQEYGLVDQRRSCAAATSSDSACFTA